MILATEATRVATNSAEYRAKIKEATGLDVDMLPKELEGQTGALGVISSFETVRGIMMDLGGGSTQITWIIAEKGKTQLSPAGSVSMPYGAAALSRLLDDATRKGGKAFTELQNEITSKLKEAVKSIAIPKELLDDAKSPQGLNLYLSGGGFRGWGFVLMSQHEIDPYPIPIINGFKAPVKQFHDTGLVTTAAQEDDNIFRVSDRRAGQVPAVALLVSCLTDALPAIKTVYFAQGGVREGTLFPKLSDEQKLAHPVETATNTFATASSLAIFEHLLSSVPDPLVQYISGIGINKHIIKAFAQSMYIHNALNKDIQGASGLRSTTTGVLGAMHGADHEGRALLAIMLCERWGGIGTLSPSDANFYNRLVALLSPEASWWAVYIGRAGAILGEVYPAGVVVAEERLLGIKAGAVDAKGDEDKKKILIALYCSGDVLSSEAFVKAVKKLDKLGKKKNWPRGSGGYKVDVDTRVLA